MCLLTRRNTGNNSTDVNVKEQTKQVEEPSQPTGSATTQTTVPLTVQLESATAPLESSAPGGSVEANTREVAQTPRLPAPKAAGAPIPTQEAYRGLRSRGSANHVRGPGLPP